MSDELWNCGNLKDSELVYIIFIWPLPVKNFKIFFLWHQAVHIMYLNVDRQGYLIKTVAYSLRTERQTDRRTDKSLKTEGPKILSDDIFYFRTVIIGGAIPTS